jgi:hypothetical protein
MPPRISLTELYSMKDKKEQIKHGTFDKIIETCHSKIRKTALIGGMNIFFEVPYIVLGAPLYKIEDCVNYVLNALRNNGLYVQILPPPNTNMLYVSWNPSDVTYKKQLGYTNPGNFPMNI